MPFDYDGQWNANGKIGVLHWAQTVENRKFEFAGAELDYTVTYHDPCHLGQYNDEYEEPREIIKATGSTGDEMPRNHDDSFCCNGGSRVLDGLRGKSRAQRGTGSGGPQGHQR